MAQEVVWEKEYKNPKLITKEDAPQQDLLRFLKYLDKQGVALEGLSVLDLGSGTGRNANYLSILGAEVIGLEISNTAIEIARSRAELLDIKADYRHHSIGVKYPFDDNSFDLVLDVTSSNSLNEAERAMYLSEVNRVLKKDAYFFVKGLCKDGDKNAKALLKKSPGTEIDTYTNEDMGLVERVFSRQDFINHYSKYFNILELNKKTNYTRFKGQSYKRNFWLAYMKKI